MPPSNEIQHIVSAWKFLLMMAIAGAVAITLVSFLFPLRYSSTVRMLVTQTVASDVDPYTAMKSAERVAGNLAMLLQTSTFMDKTLTTAAGFDDKYFPSDDTDKRKLWSKTVVPTVTAGSGLITVVVYHPKVQQAEILADAAARTLVDQTSNYFGENVHAQLMDTPLNSKWIVRPRFLQNAIFGLVAGFLIGFAFVLIKIAKQRS